MKKFLAGTVIASVAWILTGAGTPSGAVTISGDVQAHILAALSFTQGDTLDFGSISPGSAASVVRIAPNTGARTLVSGDAVLVTGGSEGDGTFMIDGVNGLNVLVDIPATATVTQGFAPPMTVDNFTWSYNNGAVNTADGPTTLATGSTTLSIGADLHVGIGQASGSYAGTYSVTVNYQ